MKRDNADKFVYTIKHFSDPEHYQLMLQKRCFSIRIHGRSGEVRGNVTLGKCKLFSKVNDSGISADEYFHATKVWEVFGITNL